MKHVGLLLGCLMLIASSAMAQSRTKGVVPQLVAQPIKVNTPAITGGRSWVGRPLVQVENVSTKPIQYLMIETMLPGAKTPFMLAFGQGPGKSTTNATPLQPGAKIDLSVDQNACVWIKDRLLELDLRALNGDHVTARINAVVFNDQTAWIDGLPHVMDPNNPRRWNVVKNTAMTDPLDAPEFGFLKVGFRETGNNQMCWIRLGTEFIDCCGFQQASAILVQAFGGIYEPFPMSSECEPGVTCEWTKAVTCRDPGF